VKLLLIIFCGIILPFQNLKSQNYFYVQNDTTEIVSRKALDFFQQNICSLATYNFKTFLKSKKHTLYYKIFKQENGKEFLHFSPELYTIVERGRTLTPIKKDTCNYSVNFIKKSFEKVDSSSCYISISFLVRQNEIYFLKVRANEAYGTDNWLPGWETTFVFTFDRNLVLKSISYSEALND
jgi:hypothetical protein